MIPRTSRSITAGFCFAFAAVCLKICCAQAVPRLPGELAWTIGYDPKTFDPAKVDDQDSEMVRYLTAGVLLRFNRLTEKVEPDLAESWTVSPDGKIITFKLRAGLQFSDGSSLTSKDAAWSITRVLLPATAAPVADEFVSPGQVTVETPDRLSIVVHLPKRVIGIGKVFDEIAIEPANRPTESRVTSGPFVLTDYRRSQFVRLGANPRYWKRNTENPSGTSGVRLDILENDEQQVQHFLRGDYDMIDHVPPEYFELLKTKLSSSVRDLGPSLNTEQMWFNQAASAPIPAWEKGWFQSRAFRLAVSQAIHRADLARIAYLGHATPAYNFISPANSAWYDSKIAPLKTDVPAAKIALAAAGFHMNGSQLQDSAGHSVKFSILTNASNAARVKMATLIQQDLAALGMQVTVVPLDFPSLIERLMHTQDYEACLLGLENVDPDPNAMMNIWTSSSPNHQWNPSQKTPATQWEADIDRAMVRQATAQSLAERKLAVDRVQEIIAEEQPFVYLVYPNILVAISPGLQGVQPAILEPNLVWNVEQLSLREVK
jgi:peptide/nickel transport system substrate-binding protein